MKLDVRFLQLPILFDADKLAEEIAAAPAEAWRPHPQGFAGNDAMALITTNGDPASDVRAGPMAPTPALLACPYLMQVLETLGATWGRSRLMRLSGNAEVSMHVDTDYYWRDHMRVHVPIVTQPTVRFLCADEEVNMAPGECWVFDTWSLHSVHNDATRERIHLVADTVGGEGLLSLMENGRSPANGRADWSPRLSPPRPGVAAKIAYESRNVPTVMTPWEMRDHISFLLSELEPGCPDLDRIKLTLNRMRVAWHALWAEHGDAAAARPAYDAVLVKAWRQLQLDGVDRAMLVNRMPLGRCIRALIFDSALVGAWVGMDAESRAAPAGAAVGTARPVEPGVPSGQGSQTTPAAPPRSTTLFASRFSPAAATGVITPSAVSTRRTAPPTPMAGGAPAAGRAPGADPVFDRPIFIVSSPRSGSTLLFETLSNAPGLLTIGGESHGLMESIPAISPASRGWDSNRLTAADAVPPTAQPLRDLFRQALRDRIGVRPFGGRLRMLEKTPKNALRIPFLARAFPEARFIYLHRDPRPTLASMMEAWSTGRFQTYPQLPGWTGMPWSLLLVPGWRDLIGAPLNQIVARQWATTTRLMLDDLADLPRDRWRSISYEAFIAEPQSQIAALCSALDLTWDRALGENLPLARHTVSPPDADKWRVHADAIDSVLPGLAAEETRARSFLS